MFEVEQLQVDNQIREYCRQLGLPEIELKWTWIPFNGQWGISTTFFQVAAASQSEGKGKVGEVAAQLAASISEKLQGTPGFEKIEAVNGYLNLYFSSSEYFYKIV